MLGNGGSAFASVGHGSVELIVGDSNIVTLSAIDAPAFTDKSQMNKARVPQDFVILIHCDSQ